jgi:hypothetical protein
VDEAVYDVIRNGTTDVIFKKNGSVQNTHDTQVPAALLDVDLGMFGSSAEMWHDWALIRKYVHPEPSYIIGSEQDPKADAGIYHNSFSLNSSEGFLIKQLSRSMDGEGHAFAYWLANITGNNISSAYFARDGGIANLSRRNDSSINDLSVNSSSNQSRETWYIYEVFRIQSGGMRVVRNGSQLIGWVYDSTSLTNSSLAIGRWGNGSSEYDWLLVRKYLDPEPSASLDLEDQWIIGASPWWEYPVNSTPEEKKNASRALGLNGYDFYMQLRPLNESLFNEVMANYNITRIVPDAGAALVERYVFIRGPEALVKASGKTAGYRLVLWVW